MNTLLTQQEHPSALIQQTLDLVFPVAGGEIPAHHGYTLYSAIAAKVPLLHEETHRWRMSTIPCKRAKEGSSCYTVAPGATWRIRLPLMLLPALLQLSGAELDLWGQRVRLGNPIPYNLQPHPELYARRVVIKGYQEPDEFRDAIHRQLIKVGVDAKIHIPVEPGTGQPQRRVLKVKADTIVGFPVVLSGLTTEHSLLIQAIGLGGKGHMGCGFFQAVRPPLERETGAAAR